MNSQMVNKDLYVPDQHGNKRFIRFESKPKKRVLQKMNQTT